MAFFPFEIDIEPPALWTKINLPNKAKGSLALMGFPGLLIGGDSHSYIAPDWLNNTFSQLYKSNCRTFYTFAHPDDLPENACEQAEKAAKASGINFHLLPINDFATPSACIEKKWQQHLPQLLCALEKNEMIALSCLSGIGRTGMMAADLLTHLGMSAEEAIHWVRQSKPEAIESIEQERWVGSRATSRPTVRE